MMNYYRLRRSTSCISTQSLPSKPSLVTALTSLLTLVCTNTKWEYGEAWIPATTDPVLELSSAWSVDTNLDINRATAWMQFQICSQEFVFGRGEGLPGRVWKSHQSEWLEDVSVRSENYDPQSQTDPSFKSIRLYTRISAAEVRRQLLNKGYQDDSLPTNETIIKRLNELGYSLKRVTKTKPKKRIDETDAIFREIDKVNKEADADPQTLRISCDAKVAVKVGEFDRGGKTRTPTQALDHDFNAVMTVTPYGIFLPEFDELSLFFISSRLTADCIVDQIEKWWQRHHERFTHIRKLLINQDNGPENHSRRTQFMKRMVAFAYQSKLNIYLAYYPPYHSK